MSRNVKTESVVNYKGHTIRKVIDEIGNEFVVIDNDSDVLDDSPLTMTEKDFTYASVADAKRFINGKPMVYWTGDAYNPYTKERYWNRFK